MADPHFKTGVLDVNSLTLSEPVCSNHCFAPAWNADNHMLAYADAQFGIMITDPRVDLVQKHLDGNKILPHAWTLFNQNPQVQSPHYSPDGSLIVFQVKGSSQWNIEVANADGSHAMPITQDDPLGFSAFNNVGPTWSPDGQEILFL